MYICVLTLIRYIKTLKTRCSRRISYVKRPMEHGSNLPVDPQANGIPVTVRHQNSILEAAKLHGAKHCQGASIAHSIALLYMLQTARNWVIYQLY